ncbi:MAG: acetate kinase [Sulfurospirillaceae bacterium]|nr:acetate kinase [Sulfurospirillaceae bacterium]
MKILVLNAGSSSIKYQLYDMASVCVLANGIVEQIGETDSQAKIKIPQKDGAYFTKERREPIACHADGLAIISELLKESGVIKDLNELDGIGHRVVQGGSNFKESALVDEYVQNEIERLISLAPLHNPAHLEGIKVSIKQSPNVPQVVVFDTSFHSTIPQYAHMYAIPYKFYSELKIKKYGFHGTSHYFVAKEGAKFLGCEIDSFNAITLHLGNGASATAIKNGKSVDTSMGLTPLEGLIMGTRCGDIDPAVLFYIARKLGYDVARLDTLANKESGLKGICGNNDMREINKMVESGDERAKLALDMFNYRLKKYIGSYSAVLGRVDCVIFTGGIGENDANVRANSCKDLENLGIEIDLDKNSQRYSTPFCISTENSKVKVLVVPTNEELEIAIQTQRLIEKLKK